MTFVELSQFPDFAEAAEDLVDDMRTAVAREVEAVLTGPQSEWPEDTGSSKRMFSVKAAGSGGDIDIQNDAQYAAAVNNRQTYRSGKPNPNYDAVGRTVENNWDKVVRDAARRAGR